MAQISFKKATRTQAKGRIALIGPSGSGKTYTMLLALHTLAAGKRFAVIDTEHGSASKYAGTKDPLTGIVFDFDVLELESFAPDTYVQAIEAAAGAGYEALGIDSLSHAWSGKDGALEQVDKAAKRSQSGNTFAAWRDITPKHNALVEAMAGARLHLVVTMRSKMEYVLEEVEKNGRKSVQPRKVGLAPIQREGLEYEFDVVGDIDLNHNYAISKTRCPELDGAVLEKPGVKFAETVLAWLQTGAPAPEKPSQTPLPATNGTRKRKLRPLFSKNAVWPGAEQWASKPLDTAPLDVLLEYLEVARHAFEACEDERIGLMLREHVDAIEAEIALKEPKVEPAPEAKAEDTNADWGLEPDA